MRDYYQIILFIVFGALTLVLIAMSKKTANQEWRLKDIILVSLLGTLFGGIALGTVFALMGPLIPLFAIIGLADFAWEILFGIFIFSTTFSAYIIQKPGTASLVGLLTGAIQVLMGSPFAATVWISGLVQGVGAELGFSLFGFKKWNMMSMLVSATGATIASFLLAWFRGSWNQLAPSIVLVRFLVRLTSGLLFTGVLSKVLADRLAKAGVLKSYPLGENAYEFTGE